jgi:hypothetical protein
MQFVCVWKFLDSGEVRGTGTTDTLNPKLGLECSKCQDILSTTIRALCLILEFTLYVQTDSLGYVDINLSDVVNNKRINEKYSLIDSKNGRIQIELIWRTT